MKIACVIYPDFMALSLTVELAQRMMIEHLNERSSAART
jgi:hypothetical protein